MQRAEMSRREREQQEARRAAARQQRVLPDNPELPPGYDFDQFAPPPDYVSNEPEAQAEIRQVVAAMGEPPPPEPGAPTAPVLSEHSLLASHEEEVRRLGLPTKCWACHSVLVWLDIPGRPGQKEPYAVCEACGTVSVPQGALQGGGELLGLVLSQEGMV